MDTALEKLLRAKDPGSVGYRPILFNLPADEAPLAALLAERPYIRITDRIEAQLKELMNSLNPKVRLSDNELQVEIDKHLDGSELTSYGSWVFYPWSNQLVHLLPEVEFAWVRTDRNRNKITREEQAVLATKSIGVIGLSVGQSVSVTLALERCFGSIRLADFDTLDLSNLNRIRSGTHHLGLNKAVITAREIAEIDPYLNVTCFTDGLTPGNIDAFFTEGGKLDILVEECDSVDIKILARQKAKELRIPVVMDMSDRGCLDVERFDLEPDRPIMHGWIDHLDLEAAKRPMSAEEKVPFMLPITGVETLSPRMKASVIELGQTLSTWPQLATSVVLGGALAGDAVRRIALDQFHASGRWHVDLDEQISDPPLPMPPASPAPRPFSLSGADLEAVDRNLGPAPQNLLAMDSGLLAQIIEAGGRAPSLGNMQPWKFLWHENRLLLFLDEARSSNFWDPDRRMAHLAIGACVENMVVQAHALGIEVKQVTVNHAGEARLMAALEFHPSPLSGAEPRTPVGFFPMIMQRHTGLGTMPPLPLPQGTQEQLKATITDLQGCRMHLLDNPAMLAELAELCGAAERIRLLNPVSHREYFQGQLRWTAKEAERKRDGIDLTALALHPMEETALKIMADPRAIALTDSWHAGRNIGMKTAHLASSAPAMLLVSHSGDNIASRIKAGRAVERLWMAANAAGLSVLPFTAPLQMAHAAAINLQGIRPHEQAELERIRNQFTALWALEGRVALFMARIAPGVKPGQRSLRLPLKELLIAEPVFHPLT